jgi:hypothetical protein
VADILILTSFFTPYAQSGHFLLTNLLLDNMKATAKSTGIEGRIVNLSSVAHLHTYPKGIQFDELNDKKMYECLWLFRRKYTINPTVANVLYWQIADTMTKWPMDNLSLQTYCTQESSLDGYRYPFSQKNQPFLFIYSEEWSMKICVYHGHDVFPLLHYYSVDNCLLQQTVTL